jgi:hypothetical protein
MESVKVYVISVRVLDGARNGSCIRCFRICAGRVTRIDVDGKIYKRVRPLYCSISSLVSRCAS